MIYNGAVLPLDNRGIEKESRAEIGDRFAKGHVFKEDFQFVLDLLDYPIPSSINSKDYSNSVLFRNMKL